MSNRRPETHSKPFLEMSETLRSLLPASTLSTGRQHRLWEGEMGQSPETWVPVMCVVAHNRGLGKEIKVRERIWLETLKHFGSKENLLK